MTKQQLDAVFAADRALRTAEADLLRKAHREIVPLLTAAVTEASELADRQEASMRLARLADLCSQVPGPEMADALIAILNDDEPGVRASAGEALLDAAYDYYAEVARAVERALDKGLRGPAMAELPFMLAEIGEPSAAQLLKRFLTHPDADAVAAAIEASVELGEPEMMDVLKRLENDKRDVTMDDFEEETSATIGELATEAIKALKDIAR